MKNLKNIFHYKFKLKIQFVAFATRYHFLDLEGRNFSEILMDISFGAILDKRISSQHKSVQLSLAF